MWRAASRSRCGPDHGPGGVQVLGVGPGVAGGGAFLGVGHVDDPVIDGGQPGGGLGDQGGDGGVVDGGEDHARRVAGRGPVAVDRDQHRCRARQAGPAGADLLGLDFFGVGEQAMAGGQDADPGDDRGRGDEERDVDACGEDEPAGGVGGQAAADEPDEAVGG